MQVSLPDYLAVSRVWHQSPGLPYKSPNFPVSQSTFELFLCVNFKFSAYLSQNLKISFMHSQFLWPSFTKPTVFRTPVEPILMVCISLFMFVGSFTEICNVSGYEVDLFWPWTRESKEWFYRGYFWGWGNANESTDLRSPDVGISGSVSSISVLNVHSCPIHTN